MVGALLVFIVEDFVLLFDLETLFEIFDRSAVVLGIEFENASVQVDVVQGEEVLHVVAPGADFSRVGSHLLIYWVVV